jgi:hypothetical protein
MNNTLLVVTSGSHSDYGIVAVFEWLGGKTPEVARDEWLAVDPKRRVKFAELEDQFLAWLVRQGYAQDIDVEELGHGGLDQSNLRTSFDDVEDGLQVAPTVLIITSGSMSSYKVHAVLDWLTSKLPRHALEECSATYPMFGKSRFRECWLIGWLVGEGHAKYAVADEPHLSDWAHDEECTRRIPGRTS